MKRAIEFYPNVTPQQMFNQGIFGHSYFGVETLEGDRDYPTLFEQCLPDVDPKLYLGEKYSPKSNRFQIRCGKDYKYWTSMNWIHRDDPYGWVEWYIKYNAGRRHSDDNRQIRRWQSFAGRTGRWRSNIYRKIHNTRSWDASPRVQQSLLHWGYKVNRQDYALWLVVNNLQANPIT
tara:strand:+ start:7533 stop:8060 length:528 start_codon:yes stop_codon:yes gene_type:complete